LKKLTLSLFTILLLSAFSPESPSSTVYICTGPKAKAYHSISTCRGAKNCSEAIVAVSLAKAKKMGRRECKICW